MVETILGSLIGAGVPVVSAVIYISYRYGRLEQKQLDQGREIGRLNDWKDDHMTLHAQRAAGH